MLTGQLAVVTGATSGIGKACALALAAAGCRLHLLGRRRAILDRLVADVAVKGGSAEGIQIDLCRPQEIDAYAAQIQACDEQVGILVHSAGVYYRGGMAESEASQLDALYQLNVRGPYQLTRALLPIMKREPGQVVFVNSSAGLTTGAGLGLYSGSKYALRAITDSLRAEVNAAGIRVLGIYPGRTATDMQAGVFAQEMREYRPERLLQPEDVAEIILSCLKLPMTAEVTDIHIRPFLRL